MTKWKGYYDQYRQEMRAALQNGGEDKDEAAKEIIKKYKQVKFKFQVLYMINPYGHEKCLSSLLTLLTCHFVGRYYMVVRNLNREQGEWRRFIMRLLPYITLLTTMPGAKELFHIATLPGKPQVLHSANFMFLNKVKGPWFVQPLF